MDKYNTIIWLLPIVFMIHDFEEIIFFKPWIIKNKDSQHIGDIWTITRRQ